MLELRRFYKEVLVTVLLTFGANHHVDAFGSHLPPSYFNTAYLLNRKLKLVANSINCADSNNKTTGSFCGSIPVANYTVADAAAYFKASTFTSLLGKSPAYGVQEYVVKYKTQIQKDGSPVDATGVVALPVVGNTKAPSGGFPIIVFGHFTVGIDDYYAPSQSLVEATDIITSLITSYLRNYVAYGFILVAPDYAGLGVPNIPHYYLVKKPTAYSIIDSVRSATAFAKQLRLPVSSTTIFAGHSQGGCAVLHAMEIYDGEGYGKADFNLRAVVPIAPAPVWRYAFHDTYQLYNQEFAADVGLYFWAASKYNPKLNLTELLSPASIKVLDSLSESVSSMKLETGNYFPANVTDYLSSSIGVQDAIRSNMNGYYCYTNNTLCQGGISSPYNLTDMTLTGLSTDWQTQLDEDSPGLTLFSSVPVLLVQGSADTTVQPYYTIMLAQKMMNNGVPVVAQSGLPIALNNTADVAKEFKITSNCTSTNGQIITCGLTHTTIALAVELYVPFIFSKVDMTTPPSPTTAPSPKTAPSSGAMDIQVGSRWLSLGLLTVAAFICF